MQPGENKTTSPQPASDAVHAASAASELLAGLNHEIRTAMNGVVGILDLLLDASLAPAHRELAVTAQNSAQDLVAVIGAATDLAAVREGCLQLESNPFELSAVLKAAIDEAGVTGMRTPDALPAAVVLGDPARLQQAVAALLRIASCAGSAGEVRASAERRGARCALSIDIAIGKCCAVINEAAALAANLPAGIEVMRTHGRLGLDVELCRHLAALMGGDLSINRLDGMSGVLLLSMEFPFAEVFSKDTSLLIIENDDGDKLRLASLFLRQGMQVRSFASAAPALDALRQHGNSFNAAIIGRDAQGMDAELLAMAIRAELPASRLALAALCDDASEAARNALAQAGFGAVIARPVNEAAALAALASLCGDGSWPQTNASPASRHEFTGRRILVADDNAVNLHVAQRMLENLGCRVDVAADGSEALAKHQAHPYELILMDCQMPGMDGCEAAMRIRQAGGAASRVPVIAVTACATPADRQCCLAAGMNDFIAKPLRPQVLDATLAKWLDAQAPAANAGPNPAPPLHQDELDAVKDMFGADFAELAKLYCNDSPPRIAKLHEAAAAGDSAAVAKTAHAFSGSCASIGASGLARMCKELELHAKTGMLDQFAQRMAAIEVEYERICGRLDALRDQ